MTNQADAQPKQESETTMDPQRLLAAGQAEEPGSPADSTDRPVPFLADRQYSLEQLRQLLSEAEPEERRDLTSQIVRFAPWDEIWTLITPQELHEELPHLGLSESLSSAWTLWLTRKLG